MPASRCFVGIPDYSSRGSEFQIVKSDANPIACPPTHADETAFTFQRGALSLMK